MTEQLTVDQVRDGLRAMKTSPHSIFSKWADALDAHLNAAKGEAVEMSPEFTDHARAAIAWVLWHHQGASSPIGQPLRFALGMGAHEPLPYWRIREAKQWAALAKATTAAFHPASPDVVRDAERWASFKRYVSETIGGNHLLDRLAILDIGAWDSCIDELKAAMAAREGK